MQAMGLTSISPRVSEVKRASDLVELRVVVPAYNEESPIAETIKRICAALSKLPGYAAHFDAMDRWLLGFDGLLTFGRQGLFAHDNTHHALTMACAAADCLKPDGIFDRALWSRHRRHFESHVVED
jgi:hypothetical protein